MPATGGKRSGRSGKNSAKGAEASRNGPGAVDSAATGRVLMDLDFVRGLIAAVDESGIDSLEIYRAGTRIRIAKTPAAQGAPVMAVAPPAPGVGAAPAPAPAAPAPAAPAAEAAAEAPTEAPPSNLIEVKSPMVGTFYRAPAPEAPPYVEVGSRVGKGQTLCILEAMKLMNELESEVDGVVREILVSNAEPVEYGQVLFRIEPVGA
ncbi:MAG TPA: acetyl-CoA carboxylase biotin carboxyl carrier protein [Longimicrobiales bacterium]